MIHSNPVSVMWCVPTAPPCPPPPPAEKCRIGRVMCKDFFAQKFGAFGTNWGFRAGYFLGVGFSETLGGWVGRTFWGGWVGAKGAGRKKLPFSALG